MLDRISGIWKGPKTTIMGLVVLAVVVFVGIAMTKGYCSFDQFWEKVVYLIGILSAAGGLKLMLSGKDKSPPSDDYKGI